jgi:hypothetical protein
MRSRHKRSLIGVLAVGIVGIFAIGASSASAAVNTTNTQTLAIKAFVDNGFQGTLVGVPGAAVTLDCSSGNGDLFLLGTASNGMAKAAISYPYDGYDNVANNDLDTTDTLPMNYTDDANGHMEFVNGAQTRTLTAQYSTTSSPPNSTADCAVWGTAVKGLF